MSFSRKPVLLAVMALLSGILIGSCQTVGMAIDLATYERVYDAYSQDDTTVTELTNTRHADGRDAALISAFFGLDNALPDGPSDRAVCTGANGADGMPVIFSHEVDHTTLEPGDFKVTTASGATGEVDCLTLDPANDPGELRTVLFAGDYGSLDDQPVTVEVVGNVLSLDGTVNFKGSSIGVTPLEVGPTMGWAEIVPETRWDLGAKGTSFVWGGGSRCPIGTKQVVLVAWNGGITKPGGEPADEAEGQLYEVTVLGGDGTETKIAPASLADLKDGDNNHLLCLNTTDTVTSVFFPAGHVTDPREDLNPHTTITLSQN